jgi:hypothetical protein
MSKKIIHLVFIDLDDEAQSHVFDLHNDRDELLEQLEDSWKEVGGEKNDEPFTKFDLIVPATVPHRDLAFIITASCAITFGFKAVRVQFY